MANRTIQPIISRVGPGILRRVFGGKSLIHCIVELVKNSRDWGATKISIITHDQDRFVITDNGDGMNGENRNAFASVNLTTAGGVRQAGSKGTGSKWMLFSFAKHCHVRTAPKEELDLVYIFDFKTDEYEQRVFAQGTMIPTVVRKTKTTWPYNHPFGTEMTFTYEHPEKRRLMRGVRLAEELTARFPRKFADIVRIDGARLPDKEIIGQWYERVIQNRQLGVLSFELYRPKGRRRGEEDLRLCAVEVGEAPMRSLYPILPSDLQEQLPGFYLLPNFCCGTIAAAYLRDYANEDRLTLDSGLGDDPRTRHLVNVFVEIAPEVQRCLEIHASTEGEVDSVRESVQGVAGRITALYEKSSSRRPRAMSEGGGRMESLTSPQQNDEVPDDVENARTPMRLKVERYEQDLGEEFNVTVWLDRELRENFNVSDVAWYIDRAKARKISDTPDGIRLRAHELGPASVSADIIGTSYRARARYEIVAQRMFRFNAPYMAARLGSVIVILPRNIDKIHGDLVWSLEGPGICTPQGNRALYHAIGEGTATIRAHDSKNRKTSASCEITVRGKPMDMMCIRDRWFQIDYIASGEDSLPVQMIAGGDTHRLFVSERAPGVATAMACGQFSGFFLQAVASEFPFFERFDLRGETGLDIAPADFLEVQIALRRQGFELFAELLKGIEKK